MAVRPPRPDTVATRAPRAWPPSALEALGWPGARVRQLAPPPASVWRLQASDRRAVLRALREGAPAPDALLTLMATLADAGLHVPRPHRAADGGWVHTAAAGGWAHSAIGARWLLLDHLPGRVVFNGLRSVHARRAGEFIGRLHHLCAAVPAPVPAWGADLAAWADGRRRAPLPVAAQARLARAARAVQAALAGAPEQWIHGDLHAWNLLHHQGRAGAIDFDDSGRGPPALDLAALLQHLTHPILGHADHRPRRAALRGALLEGYARWREPPPDAQIDAAVAWRQFGTLQWILDDWPRPDARPWGPAFLATVADTLVPWSAAA